MTAPTLPTKAERDDLRRDADWLVYARRQTLLRLLDWADAQERAAEDKRNLDREDAAIGRLLPLSPGDARRNVRPVNVIIDDPLMPCDSDALRALRRLVAAVVESQCAELGFDAPRYRASEVETAAALEAAEAVLAGGQPAPREVVGYRVRWTDTRGCEDQSTFRIDDGGNARLDAYECAYELLEVGRARDVRIRKLTRPVRDKSTGGGLTAAIDGI